jgi:ADP-heptose:LPS heptosyltransferase
MTVSSPAPEQPRILVIRRRYLGDIVLLGSLFRNLRLHWPKAVITALVEPGYAGVLAINPDVDSVISPPSGILQWPGFLLDLRGRQFSHAINFDNNERTALITRLTGARTRIAVFRDWHRLRLGSFYTRVIAETENLYWCIREAEAGGGFGRRRILRRSATGFRTNWACR